MRHDAGGGSARNTSTSWSSSCLAKGWRDEPLAVFRITGSEITDTGRVEFPLVDADAKDTVAVLAAVQGQGACNSALRYASI